jgi:GT2 family glycosyltransferase
MQEVVTSGMPSPSLAVVIVNYNTRDLLAQCLESLAANDCRCPPTVFVVDNRSTDDSAAMVRERFPDVRLIESDRNGGYGYANNLALRVLAGQVRAGAYPAVLHGPPPGGQPPAEIPAAGDAGLPFPDYVLLLNPDTVLPPTAMQAMVDFLEDTPEAGVVGPRLEKPDGTLDLAARRSFPRPMNALFKLTGLSRLLPRHPAIAEYNLTHLSEYELTEVDSVNGAFMLVRGTALGQAGLFDERFFMYGEDLDLAYRIKARGWKVYYNPVVTVLHVKGASSRKQSTRSIREFYRAMHIFYSKHYARRYGMAVSALVRVGITLREGLALAQNALRPPARRRVT